MLSSRRAITAIVVACTALLPVAAVTAQAPSAETRLVVGATGNEARYRVREQLAGLEFPNDAVGVTSAVSGEIVLDGSGQVQADRSTIVVDLRTLKSDKDRRDGYVQRRTLETEQFPEAVLRVTGLGTLPHPLPTSGEFSFTLTGDLTIHGTTRPTSWSVTGRVEGDHYHGTATTRFTFAEFGLTKPRVAAVLSVDDEIALEYEFHFVKR